MSSPSRVELRADDALLVVDVQNDFLPGGALAVTAGDLVVPVLNRYIHLFEAARLPIIASRDWHPANHCSFEAQGGPWPVHCVAGTRGAAFAPNLGLPGDTHIVSKADAPEREAYSAFTDTDLTPWLRERGVRRLFIGGLATDYCVLQTVRDALAEGFEVVLLRDTVRAVNVQPDDGEKAIAQMKQLGAMEMTLGELNA